MHTYLSVCVSYEIPLPKGRGDNVRGKPVSCPEVVLVRNYFVSSVHSRLYFCTMATPERIIPQNTVLWKSYVIGGKIFFFFVKSHLNEMLKEILK